MKFHVRPGLKLAATLLFIVLVYFQSISHPFSRFDDPFIVDFYGTNSSLSFLDVITPGSGFYYRPIVNLSYWLDFRLWGLDSAFMHLENIVVHLVNVFLVFLIASRLPSSSEIKSLPFVCALLFGLHPINSESVNWIAGRTDVFAGMFVFLAVYWLIRALQDQSTRFAVLAFIAAFFGMLTKETAIMFVPAALLIAARWTGMPEDFCRLRSWRARCIYVPLALSTGLIFSLLILAYGRRGGNNAVAMMFEGGTNGFIRILEALGFYVKKMFLPLPLNLAIRDVDPLYAIVGIITLLLIVATLRRAGIAGLFIASAVLLTIPALLVAVNRVAWTPYAERYLYIPSAFAVIGCLDLLCRFLVRWNIVAWFAPIVGIILVVASITTFHRGMLWGDNLALVEDIVAKTPDFGVARNEYGVLLSQDGRYEEAEEQFRIAAELENDYYVGRVIRLNLIRMKIREKPLHEARRILLTEIGNKSDGDVELLKLLYSCDENLLGAEIAMQRKQKIVADMIDTNQILYFKTRDPHYLYRSGQLALAIGDKKNAELYFLKVSEIARPDAYYREPARKLAEKLGIE